MNKKPTKSLLALNAAVKNSKITIEGLMVDFQIPYCTVDENRQVVNVTDDFDQFDLWVKKRKPKTYGNMIHETIPWLFGVNFDIAVMFLEGLPKAQIIKYANADRQNMPYLTAGKAAYGMTIKFMRMIENGQLDEKLDRIRNCHD